MKSERSPIPGMGSPLHSLLARHQSSLELRHRVTLDYRVFPMHWIAGLVHAEDAGGSQYPSAHPILRRMETFCRAKPKFPKIEKPQDYLQGYGRGRHGQQGGDQGLHFMRP